MSFYSIDEVMDQLREMDNKLDKLLAGEKEYTYNQHHTYSNTIDGDKRYAIVSYRNDGVWCVEKFVNSVLLERLPLPGKAEVFAENAAENFVLLK